MNLSTPHRIKVAVIGAGAAGLCAAQHLKNENDKFCFDVFEQQDHVGGTWRYSSNIGKDQYGLPVHSSMYKNLRTNLPKEVMAFPDFPFKGYGVESFLHHTQILHYLEDYAKHFDLYEHIKFNTIVEQVMPLKQNGEVIWQITTQKLKSNEKEVNLYDAVMICNGHYSVPYLPEIKDIKSYEGILLHSHDYRENSKFKNLKVVVLGAGASGIDIGLEISAVAKEVILSHNTPPKTCPLPKNMIQKEGISAIDKNLVKFPNGEIYKCDAIILCTGYLYTYPFLHPNCLIEIGDQRVTPLYKHLFNIEFPTMAFWAITKLVIPFPMYDQQVKVFLKFLKGIIQLPTKEEMKADEEKDFNKRISLGMKPRHAHSMVKELQWEYDDELSKLGDILPVPNSVRDLFRYVHSLRAIDIMNYKNVNFELIDDENFIELRN